MHQIRKTRRTQRHTTKSQVKENEKPNLGTIHGINIGVSTADKLSLFPSNVMEQYIDLLMKKLKVEAPPGYQVGKYLSDLRKQSRTQIKDSEDQALAPNLVTGSFGDVSFGASTHKCSLCFSLMWANKGKGDHNGNYCLEWQRQIQTKEGWFSSSSQRFFETVQGEMQEGRPLCFDWNLGKYSKA